VLGARVKAIYRVFGEKYTYDKDKEQDALKWLNVFTVKKVRSDFVDIYVQKEGKLPVGIIEKERIPKISLSVKKENETEHKELIQEGE
jgi:hypothetical protein